MSITKSMKKKLVMLITTCAIFLSIFAINEHERNTELRRLISIDSKVESDYKDICDRTSKSFKKKQNEGTYTYSQSSDGNGPIIEYLKDNDSGKLVEYFMELVVYIFFIAFGFVTIFIWFFYCCFCTCCKNCCCCCSQNRENNCKQIGFILGVGFLAVSAVLSVSALATSNQFVNGINGSFCGLYKLYETFIKGESKSTLPKWAGTDGIIELLNETEKEITTNLKNNVNSINTTYSRAQTEVNSTYPNQKTTCNDKNPIEKTVCELIYDEYTILDGINSQFQQIGSDNSFSGTFTDAKKEVNDIGDTINDNIKDIVSSMADIGKIIDKYLSLALKILFSFNVVVSCVEGGILLLMYLFKMKLKLFGFIYHLSWNVVCFISIYAFIIGGIFGIFGRFGEDGGKALAYIFSQENLNQTNPIILEAGTNTINTCLNDDGDLAKALNFSTGAFTGINQLYNLTDQIRQIQNSGSIDEDLLKNVSSTTANYTSIHILNNEGFNTSISATDSLFALYQNYTQNGDMFSAFNCSILLY